MKLQFYETMDDKSKEYLTYLIEQIQPKFTNSELKIFLEEIDMNSIKKSKSSKPVDNYVKIGDDIASFADLSKLTIKQLKIIFQIFISRENNENFAVRWRFYQYIKYLLNLNKKLVKININSDQNRFLDFIIDTTDKDIIFVFCYDILELKDYKEVTGKLSEFVKKQNLIPDRIVFAVNKSFRNIPIDIPIKIMNNEIIPELWIEWTEENHPFNKEDLLIVNNSEFKVAGFNFTSTDDLLEYVFKQSNGGQISIYRQFDFFTEVNIDEPEVELIWKGIMLK